VAAPAGEPDWRDNQTLGACSPFGFDGRRRCIVRKSGELSAAGKGAKRVHPTDKHVGNRLRMRRLMLSKSQSDIANALGLTFQQLQKYEKGSNRISASRLQGLCAILQVPVSFFFEGAPQEPKLPMLGSDEQSPSYVNEFLATSDGVALALAFGRIRDPKVRRAIVALVEQIVVEPVPVNSGPEAPAVAAVE
jgi:transcriptional regulator with XRE-family HTH domain